MQSSTGQVFTFDEIEELRLPKEDFVIIEGTPEAIATLSRNAKLGSQEAARRDKRRKQQRQSRKRNR